MLCLFVFSLHLATGCNRLQLIATIFAIDNCNQLSPMITITIAIATKTDVSLAIAIEVDCNCNCSPIDQLQSTIAIVFAIAEH